MSWRRRVLQRIGVPLTMLFMRVLWATYRFRIDGDHWLQEAAAEESPVVLCFWHGELFVGSWLLHRLGKMGLTLTYVVSPSKDGDFATNLLEKFGGRAVRGSATRSGVKAMRGLYRAITREHSSTVILPDGPRGPRHHCKEGVVLLSQLAQAPIVPLTLTAYPAFRLRTWDKMVVPPPFARININVSRPYTVERERTSEQQELERERLEKILKGGGSGGGQ